jgi:hypothetical protein
VVSIITDLQLSLDESHILRGQGIDPDRARPEIVTAARDVLDNAQGLFTPAAMLTTLPVRDSQHHQVTLEGGVVFEGPLVARALAGATDVAVGVCTVGSALDEQVNALFAAGEPVRALALDGAGTAAVGEVSRLVGERVCDLAISQGARIGMWANPGQEGWSIYQQRVVFGLLEADAIGVRLTANCLMVPRKSVSFVVGIGPEMRADAVACDFCSKRERCQWQRQADKLYEEQPSGWNVH